MCVVLAAGTAQAADTAAYPITFRENETTGYTWVFTISDETVLSVADGGYQAPAADEPMVGMSGTHAWTVGGLREGEASVTFTYTRSWEDDPDDPAVTLYFAVNAEQNLTLLATDGLPEQYMPDKAVVCLWQDAANGYWWSADTDGDGLLTPDSQYTVAGNAKTAENGIYTWIFSGTAAGTVVVTFRSTRAFMPYAAPVATVKLTYLIDEQLHVTLLGIDGDYTTYAVQE